MEDKKEEREAPQEKLTRRAFLSLASITALLKPYQDDLEDKKNKKK